MRLEIAHNAKRGILFGTINKVISLLLPFLVQTILIYSLGKEYAGVKGLFTSVLQVFNLIELGFGSAVVYSMYKPIAEGNTKLLCALLALYRKIYCYIGLIILGLGLLIIPFLQYFSNGDCPADLDLRTVYLFYLANTVLSYCFFAYRSSLYLAYQRLDILSILYTITSLLTNVTQILVLIVYKNFYGYLVVAIICTVLNNLMIYLFSKKTYPDIIPKGSVDNETKKELIEKIKGLGIYKFLGITRNAFDNIYLALFIGFNITAIYSNYFYILTAVSGFLSIIVSSLVAGIGNSIKLNSVEKNRFDFEKLDCVYTIISGWCMTCMICLYQPFIEVWVGESMQFPFYIAVMFGIYFYLLQIGNIRSLYADAAGLWWENRYRVIVEAIANIILNYLFVRLWGVLGVVLATMITIIYGFVHSAIIIYKCYFIEGLRKYFYQHIKLAIVNGTVCFITYFICSLYKGNAWFVILFRFGLCCVLALGVYAVFIQLDKKSKESVIWIYRKIQNKKVKHI